MEIAPTKELTFHNSRRAASTTVEYSAHLWRSASRDTWDFVLREETVVLIAMSVSSSIAAALSWIFLGDPSLIHGVLSAAAGVAAASLCYGVILAAHLLYSTPKKLCLSKQKQLEEERALRCSDMNRTIALLATKQKRIEELMREMKLPKAVPPNRVMPREEYGQHTL